MSAAPQTVPADGTEVFPAALDAAARATDAMLADLVARGAAPFEDGDRESAPAARLWQAMGHALFAGGKRLRPFLVLTAADICAADPAALRPNALRVAAALELVHCYSLVHDDLPAMDDDDMRRGQPTVHREFDEATAILAGDAMLTLAFEVLADPATHADGAVRATLVGGLARAAGAAGMVAGQALDLAAETVAGPSPAFVRRLQGLKTGALIAFACEAGAIVAGAGDEARTALRRYGEHLGALFQITDDLLDVEGEMAVVGKAVGKDADRGKATFVGLLGVEGARAQARECHEIALESLDLFGERADLLGAAAEFVLHRRA